MSISKYNIIEKPKIFNENLHFHFSDNLDIDEADWKLIASIMKEFRSVVMECGINEAMDLYSRAHSLELEDNESIMTKYALTMLAQTFNGEIN